ncbi:hypothetical protein EDD37DRAFT_680332 [Exophiala viscosa]|uniref:uncharacterized protein n=1 Tax=Exophiala viscosa TaxID=2486360 RepID=UPI00219857E4|nr:hypothetical protein EDD37DRAFT_680332 [Exophiala viscosa]
MSDLTTLPDFDSLPGPSSGGLDGCAWGLFDRNGQTDQLGTLNLLTQEKVLDAAKREILCGQTVSLNWGLENPQYSGFKRMRLHHRIIDLSPSEVYASDDELSFCPQHGSHWDTPLHFAHQKSKKYYNGLSHQEFHLQNALHQGTRLWNDRGGICGRGILLDWASWAKEKNLPCHPIGRDEITVSQLEEVAKWQKTTFMPGDILLIRTGFIAWSTTATDDEKKRGSLEGTEYLGIEATRESCRWHWNHHFSAVVSDNVTYEVWPPRDVVLHEYFLAMWGMPVGKLWDMEKLAEVCRSLQRWSFFLTSAPLNVASGIGSPANAIALF